MTLAKQQHRDYVSVLKEAGIEVIELDPLDDFPDSVFMQDPALLGLHASTICRFSVESRRGEEKALVDDLRNHAGKVGELRPVIASGTLEGGDIVVTDRGLFVGESSRSNAEGIGQLSDHLNHLTVKTVQTGLFHLLCGCSYLSEGTMIIAPELLSTGSFPDFRFVAIPKQEAYACDALYIGDRSVVIPAGYHTAASKLRAAGYVPVELDVSEFKKGDGGVTCLSSPIYKLF